MSKIAVIGGAGFIGRCLVDFLLRDGYEVRVVGRSPEHPSGIPGLTFCSADVVDANRIARCIEDTSIVYHLATGGGNSWADFERNFLQGTRNVAEACLQHKVKRLIYTSSIAALYLGGRGTVTDGTPLDPKSRERGLYSRAKAETESLLKEYASRLPVVILRPGAVVGPHGILTHGALGYWPSDTCCLGWGSGNNPLPFVLVQDVAMALHRALDTPGIEGRSFNLVGDVRLSAREFVGLIRNRTRRNFRFYPQSQTKMYAIEVFKFGMKCLARKPENPFPSLRDQKSRALRANFDCSGAKRALNWQPIEDREQFLAQAIDRHIKPSRPGDLRHNLA